MKNTHKDVLILVKLQALACNFTKINTGALRDLVPFVKFKKREKHPYRSINFSKVAVKLTLLHGCFSRFLNCANGTKSRNASHIKLRLEGSLQTFLKTQTFLTLNLSDELSQSVIP